MRKATLTILLVMGLLLTGFFTFSNVDAAIGEETDRSMITTETGETTFFLDKTEGSWFIMDQFMGNDSREKEIKLYVTNPDDENKDVHLWIDPPADTDWSVKITDIEGVDDDDVIENVDDLDFTVVQLESGHQVMVVLEVYYTGDDDGAEESVIVHASLGDGNFNTSLTLNLETYEGNYFWIILGLGAAVIGLAFAGLTAKTIMKKEVGSEKLKELSGYIRDGATAFLNAEYKYMVIFVIGVVVFLGILSIILGMNPLIIPAFLVGAFFSATAGNIGMRVATMANAKTAWACKESQKSGLRVAFNSGSVMGLTVVGLGLLGVTLLYILFGDVDMLFGFGFGASSIALFARVGGGIYTKAADVGADLVGKVEAGIPEDDPRNPATIADNVGDNVGDVAGMGADLFESYVDSIIAAMALGIMGVSALRSDLVGGGAAGSATLLPILLAGWGILSALVGTFFVGAGGEGADAHKQLNRGIWASAIIMVLGSLGIMYLLLGGESNSTELILALFISLATGLGSGIVIGKITEYYTSDQSKPTQKVSEASKTGSGPNIIAGLGLGMISTAIPVIAVVFTIIVAYIMADLYGIALAAVGMLSTLGITLATDTYGPVADNAAGLAEMAGMGKKVRETAEELDGVGNTTAAIGKGFAIGSAGLTALALFSAFTQAANLDLSQFTLVNPLIVSGLFVGGLLPFIFSALTMQAVGDAAQDMVEEVRRQFKSIKGIMEGKATPDYERCVAISTQGALKRMVLPSLIAVLVPVIVGCISLEALGGLLAGSIVTGFVLAVMMANAGGAWDNAKKFIEAGNFGGKGSEAHKAAVVGDTVGDPFKDTSGPSLNILIKLMSIVSLVFVPLFLVVNGYLPF